MYAVNNTLLGFSTYLFPQWLTLIIYIIILDSQLLIQGDQNRPSQFSFS